MIQSSSWKMRAQAGQVFSFIFAFNSARLPEETVLSASNIRPGLQVVPDVNRDC